jgi:hypothetical protein
MMQGYRFGRPGNAAEIDMRLSVPASFTISDAPSDLAMAG